MSTFNVCYAREYIDPENESKHLTRMRRYTERLIKYLKKFTDTKMKNKLLKYCDLKHTDNATNFTDHY